jgi:hypothetical protein
MSLDRAASRKAAGFIMAAEAAANPIPNADLRSILFIAFLPRLRNEPPQKRRAHFVVNGGAKPKKGSVS